MAHLSFFSLLRSTYSECRFVQYAMVEQYLLYGMSRFFDLRVRDVDAGDGQGESWRLMINKTMTQI